MNVGYSNGRDNPIDNENCPICGSNIYVSKYTEEQKEDAFDKVKGIVAIHNLDIFDKDINNWINDVIVTEEMKEEGRKALKVINSHLGTKFSLNTSVVDIFEEMSRQWKLLE